MMQGFGSALVRTALAMLIAVAVTAAGWAHRLPAPDSGGTGLAAYLAAGGSVSDLCGAPGGTAVSEDDCPVCRMPAALPLPARIAPATALAIAGTVMAAVNDAPRGTDRHPPWYGRAPPVV
jgi:hypothetical protein